MENQVTPQVVENQQPTTELPKPSYNPLMDNVNEKPYTSQGITASTEQLTYAIPEPMYQPQSVGSRENPYKTIQNGGSMSSGGADKVGSDPVNPSMNPLADAEKKEGAKHMTKLILDGYEQGHVFLNSALQFNPSKLRKMEAEGEIDLSIPIPDGYGNTINAGGFIQEFNEQSKDALTVSPAFKKEVTPILERVLAKRGAGLTDEQMLIYLFGKDIAVKGVIFYQMKTSMGDMIDVIRQQTEAYKQGGATMPKPQREPGVKEDLTTQPYAYAASPEPQVDINAQDFNFQNNETFVSSRVNTMSVPKTGKDRLMAQMKKEKKWQTDSQQGSSGTSYQEAMSQRKTGKRGKKKTISDYVKGVDKQEITDALILNEKKDELDEKNKDKRDNNFII
jgi:hypothetical protein